MAYQYTHVSHDSSLLLRSSLPSILSSCPPPSFSRPLLLFSHFLSYISFFGYTAREKEGLARTQEISKLGQGYMALQSTKPQTLGYGLADSPVGLLAWIYEKLIGWTDAYPWEDDEGTYPIFVLGYVMTECFSLDLDFYIPFLARWACGITADLL